MNPKKTKEEKAETKRRWREKNKEYRKEYSHIHWINNQDYYKNYINNHRDKINIKMREYRKENKAKVYIKEWRDNNKELLKEYAKLDRIKNKEKYIARRIAKSIIISKDQLCEDCYINNAKERHHQDYSKPLEIKFLCIECHKKRHRKSE